MFSIEDSRKKMTGTAISDDKVIYVRLFGRMELENKWGSVAEIYGRKSLPFSLLKYLLLSPKNEVSVDELPIDVWPPNESEQPQPSAPRVRLHRLREALRPMRIDGTQGLVLYSEGKFRLNTDYTLRIDIEAFSSLMKEIRKYPVDDPEGLKLCLDALEIYRGPLMEYTADVVWLESYRSYYKRAFCELAYNILDRLEALDIDNIVALLCQRAALIVPEETELHKRILNYLSEHQLELELIQYTTQLARSSVTLQHINKTVLQVKLFGQLELTTDAGRFIENRMSSFGCLQLKYMLLNSQKQVAEDELTQHVLPSSSSKDRMTAAIDRRHHIRELLAPLNLEKTQPLVQYNRREKTYSLNPCYDLQIDTEQFLQLMEKIENCPLEDPAGLSLCTDALELYRAPLMEKTIELPWVLEYREQFKQEFCELVRQTLSRIESLKSDMDVSLLLDRAKAIIPEEVELNDMIAQQLAEQKHIR